MEEMVKRHVAHQALVAVLIEAQEQGVLKEIEEGARERIMGNKEKMWIARADDKMAVMELLEESLYMTR